MQKDSNPRRPHKNKTSAKKYCTTDFIHLINDACGILSIFINLSLSPSSSHSLQTSPSPSLPFHNTSSVSSTASDIQHFLKPFSHCWWDALPCCFDAHWPNNTFIFFLGYKLTWTHDDSQFFQQVVLRIYTRVLDFSCLWSSQSEFMVLFMVFNVLIGPVFIFEPCS